MKIVNLNHFWLGMAINGCEVTHIESTPAGVLLTLDNGEVVKNIATSSWTREKGQQEKVNKDVDRVLSSLKEEL